MTTEVVPKWDILPRGMLHQDRGKWMRTFWSPHPLDSSEETLVPWRTDLDVRYDGRTPTGQDSQKMWMPKLSVFKHKVQYDERM